MDVPIETHALSRSDAEVYLTNFDRPGHTALEVGRWFHSEFAEFVDEFEDPHGLIRDARTVDLKEWIADTLSAEARFSDGMSGLFQAFMGPLFKAPGPDANDTERYVHAACQRFATEETPPFIKDLEETLAEAEKLMTNPTGDLTPDVENIMERLQKIGTQAEGFDDNLRTIQTLGQFFMGEQVAKATGSGDMINAMFGRDIPEGDPVADPPSIRTGDTVVAVLPVDDPWAALAWMQHGNYALEPVALLAVARDMAKRYGAVPVLATSDQIDFKVAKPARPGDGHIIQPFQALGATTINGFDLPAAAPHLVGATEWHVWWD